MCRVSDLRCKEVINIRDGLRFGFICDLELCMETGNIKSMIIPVPGRFLWFFGRGQEFRILWKEIKQIGMDIILVDVDSDKARFDCL